MSDPIIVGNRARAGAFLKKSQRDADPSNDADKSVRLESDGHIDGSFIRPASGLVPFSSQKLDAALRAVFKTDGVYHVGYDRDGVPISGGTAQLVGFIKDTAPTRVTPTLPAGSLAAISNGVDYSAPAGDNRLLVVIIDNVDGSSSRNDNVSSVTADGVEMELIANHNPTGIVGGADSGCIGMWIKPIGTSGSATSHPIVVTNPQGSYENVRAFIVENVNQDRPYATKHTVRSNNSGTYAGLGSDNVAVPDTLAVALFYGSTSGFNAYNFTTVTTRLYTQECAAGYNDCRIGSNFQSMGAVLWLKPAVVSQNASVRLVGDGTVVAGFSGLTAGNEVTMHPTDAGNIEENGTGFKVGEAISATEIVVRQSKQASEGVHTFPDLGGGSTTVHAVNLGYRPRSVSLKCMQEDSSGLSTSHGTATVDGQSCVYDSVDSSGVRDLNTNASFAGYISHLGSQHWRVTVTITDTGFEISAYENTSNAETLYTHWSAIE